MNTYLRHQLERAIKKKNGKTHKHTKNNHFSSVKWDKQKKGKVLLLSNVKNNNLTFFHRFAWNNGNFYSIQLIFFIFFCDIITFFRSFFGGYRQFSIQELIELISYIFTVRICRKKYNYVKIAINITLKSAKK